ncbi:MAG TPA: hypothetical protein VE263_19025 [Candidatus Angelobacter sp.]|nr:hypothetical protein [Candidatus Angelobacter sp.]
MASQEQSILTRMQQRAEEIVKYAAANLRLHLDYSEASIPRVEQALAEIQRRTGTITLRDKQAIINFSDNFGAYIGEVLRRKHGGEWRVQPPQFPEGKEGLYLNGTTAGPLHQVFLRLTRGPEYSVEKFYKEAEARFAQKRAADVPPPATPKSDDKPGMSDLAAKAILDAKERFGIALDYSEASLDQLDRVMLEIHNLLTDNVPSPKRLPEPEKFLLKPMAAPLYVGYLTELFCKILGAEWRTNVPGCPPEASRLTVGGKLLELTLRGQALSPAQLIVNCMNDPQRWSAKNYFLDVKRTFQVDSAMTNAASLDEQMAVCAQEAATLARDRYGITLDFSEASVKELESLLAGMHTSLPKAGDPARPSDQWLTGVAVTFGAYLGEIFRKNLGGKWMPQNPVAPGSLPALNVLGNTLTPCRKVLKRILEGPAENVAFFYNGACQIIRERTPPPSKYVS